MIWKAGSLAGIEWGLGSLLILFLILPLAGLFSAVTLPGLRSALAEPVVIDAMLLSLSTSLLALCFIVLVGTPLAHRLAVGRPFRAQALVETLLQLPWVMPPAVAGLALLMAFGRYGLVGSFLYEIGIHLPFSTVAVIIAQVFEGSAFYVQSARQAFRAMDRELVNVSRTLGAGLWRSLWRVELPLARTGLLTGAGMAWARALGEFGATMLFAGNMQGVTQTMPLAIYTVMEENLDAALAMAVIQVIIGFGLLWGLSRLRQLP